MDALGRVAVGVLALLVSILVLVVAPRRGTNRILSLFLLVEGANFFTEGMATARRSVVTVTWATGFMLPWLYLLFVGSALDAPLARPLRRPAIRWILVSLVTVSVGLAFATTGAMFSNGPALFLRTAFLVLASTYGFIAAVQAFRRTKKGSAGRRRTRAYLIAFAARDAGWAILPPLAVTPLQHMAEGMARKAVPDADGSADYLAFRKMEVYREAAEGLLADGKVTPKERKVLDRLREKLGIAAKSANALEKDVLKGIA